MTIILQIRCPDCNHTLCSYCRVEDDLGCISHPTPCIPKTGLQPLPASTSDHDNRAPGKGRKWKYDEMDNKKPGPDYNEKSMGESSKEVPSSTDQTRSDSADVDIQRSVTIEYLILPKVSGH